MKYLRLKTTTGYIDRLDIVPPVEGSDCESLQQNLCITRAVHITHLG